MDSGLPSNFGKASPFCDFEGQGGPGPSQIWDPSRPHHTYQGGLHMTAGSNPDAGFGPFDQFKGSTSNDAFWGKDVTPHTPVLGE